MSPKRIQQIKLLVVVLIIVGVIGFIESGKVRPSSDAGNQDIDVAAIADENANGDEVAATENPSEADDPVTLLSKTTEERIAEKQEKFEPAKEISTPDGFINVDDINVTDLIGEKIILVDFWTYSCINCQRTLPFLNDWHEKYADDGLVILGLHTPEFEFEKDYDNVSRAVEKWGIEYPVILDNDYSTWRSYENRYWPRKYLIDIDGFIVYDRIGEGAYDETEAKIVELLNEKKQILGEETISIDTGIPENVDDVDFRQVGSPETYLGSSRLERIANLPNVDCIGRTCTYEVSENVLLNSFQLEGRWDIQPEEVILEGETGSIFYRFKANKVNLVAGSAEGVKAEIYLDGELISEKLSGEHVTDGVVEFTESDLYNLVDQNGVYSEHLIEIRFLEPGVEAFAFTFG